MPTINSIDSKIPIEIEKGGTNSTDILGITITNGTVIFDGTRLVTTATGSATQVLRSNGASAPAYATAPTTSMIFQVIASDPGSPTNGQVWYNSTSNTFKGKANGSIVTFMVS